MSSSHKRQSQPASPAAEQSHAFSQSARALHHATNVNSLPLPRHRLCPSHRLLLASGRRFSASSKVNVLAMSKSLLCHEPFWQQEVPRQGQVAHAMLAQLHAEGSLHRRLARQAPIRRCHVTHSLAMPASLSARPCLSHKAQGKSAFTKQAIALQWCCFLAYGAVARFAHQPCLCTHTFLPPPEFCSSQQEQRRCHVATDISFSL